MRERKTRVLHPFAFALWPVLELYAGNVGEATFLEVAVCAVIVLLFAAALYVLVRRFSTNRFRAGIVLSIFLVLFFSWSAIYGALHDLVLGTGWTFLGRANTPLLRRWVLLALAIPFVAFVIWLRRSAYSGEKATRVANLVGAVLVVLAAGRIAVAELQQTDIKQASVPDAGKSPGARPDIWYLVFDRYPNRETLSREYGFDNGAFYDALEKRGFYLAHESRANYAMTTLALATTLNMDYLPEDVTFSAVIDSLQDGNRVGRFLKEQGYEYLHVGNWYYPTKEWAIADVNLQFRLLASEFAMVLFEMTPLEGLIKPGHLGEARVALWQFEQLQKLPGREGPKFVSSHIALPHTPFLLDREGNRVEPVDDYGKESIPAFVEQLRYVNKRVLQLIDRILEAPGGDPVIFLQSDEGPYLRGDQSGRSRKEQLRIRTGVLHAVRGVPHDLLRPDLTHVNAFRVILRHHFGADLEPLEERIYSWPGMIRPIEPLTPTPEFHDVTDVVRD